MKKSPYVRIPRETRRTLNNSFEYEHPFCMPTGGLEDLLSIFNTLRTLEPDSFLSAVNSIRNMVDEIEHCESCHGLGLAYLKALTKGVSQTEHALASQQYKAFVESLDEPEDFELDLEASMVVAELTQDTDHAEPVKVTGDGKNRETALQFPESQSHAEDIHLLHQFLSEQGMELQCQRLVEMTETHIIDAIETDQGILWAKIQRDPPKNETLR